MQLYLSSFRVGCAGEWFAERARRCGDGRVGVIANGVDDRADADRRAALAGEVDRLAELGLETFEIDLREPDSAEAVATAGAVWVRGGNVFLLRRRVADSGVEDVLRERILNGDLLYGGYSAGPVLLCADMSHVRTVDDPRAAGADPRMDGLGILDRPFVPHVDSPGHPETDACTAVSDDLTARGIDHHRLRNGDALIIDGETTRILRAA